MRQCVKKVRALSRICAPKRTAEARRDNVSARPSVDADCNNSMRSIATLLKDSNSSAAE